MRQRINLLTMLALIIILTACNKDQNKIQGEDQQLLQVNTLEEITGNHTEGGILVNYSATIDDKDMVHLTTELNGKTLEAFASYERYTVRYDGHDNSLTRDELQALSKTSDKIAQALFPELEDGDEIKVNAVQNTVVTVLAHWSAAPANYPIGTKGEIGGLEKGTGNNGISCVRRGSWYWIAFDDDRIVDQTPGNTTTLYKEVDGDGGPLGLACIGRCGGRCGGWWVFWSTWSLDCFEHDWCYSYHRAGTGAGDMTCGDEWWEASDDYTFGFLSGCGG